MVPCFTHLGDINKVQLRCLRGVRVSRVVVAAVMVGEWSCRGSILCVGSVQTINQLESPLLITGGSI